MKGGLGPRERDHALELVRECEKLLSGLRFEIAGARLRDRAVAIATDETESQERDDMLLDDMARALQDRAKVGPAAIADLLRRYRTIREGSESR